MPIASFKEDSLEEEIARIEQLLKTDS